MNYVKFIDHDTLPPKLPKVHADGCLHPKLDKHPLLSHMNHCFFALFLGSPGHGKTTTWISMLDSPKMFNHVFDRVYLYMPESSLRNVDEKDPVRELPPDRFFHQYELEDAKALLERLENNEEEGFKSLVIFDDMQDVLKKSDIKREFLKTVANRRQFHTAIIISAQNITRVPKEVRDLASDLFTFNLNNGQYDYIKKEMVTMESEEFQKLVSAYREFLIINGNKNFLYFSIGDLCAFVGWKKEFDGLLQGTKRKFEDISQENSEFN